MQPILLITGALRGIGAATALSAATEGIRVNTGGC
jgi:NAD(P)-dependent dehydrogenase (short-subunit alcohol dehydrogenase family)